MSIFSAIGSFFKKVFGSEQNWAKAATVTLDVAQPLLSTLLTLTVGAGVATEVTGIITTIQADLKTVTSIVTTAGTNPTVASTLSAVLSNLQSLGASLAIKDPTTQTAVTAIVSTLIGEVQAIIAEIPVVKSAA